MPSIRVDASKAITSASDEECETAPCFLHIHVIGAKVFGPTRTIKAPEVDLLSFRSPAKLASAYKATLILYAGSPTNDVWTQSTVQFM